MQTFLPHKDFKETASCLDYKRLGKQRLESLQLLNASLRILSGEEIKGWKNHPARLMWANHLYALCQYGIVICDEWICRGYKDSLRPRFISILSTLKDNGLPPWINDERIHISHRSNLLRKGRERLEKKGKRDTLEHYRKLWPDTPDSIPYYWPVKKD